MNRTAIRALWAASIVLSVAAVAVKAAIAPDGAGSAVGVQIALVTYATVGAVVASRRRHPIGSIYLFGSLAGIIGTSAGAWVVLERADPGVSAFWPFAMLLDGVLFPVSTLVLVALPLLLFPDGKLPTPRWRPVLWTAVAGIALVATAWTFRPGYFDEAQTASNPLGIRGARPLLDLFNAVGLVVAGCSVVAAIVSLFVRYRRAHGEQRQQLKWLGWAGVWTIALVFLSGPGYYSGMLPSVAERALAPVIVHVFGLALALIPLAVAVAVLRYHLWDIDRIISRTLSYAIVTVVVVGVFAVVAVVPSTVLGTANGPDWVIALATLVAAALFRPLLGRVRSAVDHRFNRRRYDAARTVEAFAARLREQIDIDALGTELCAVVNTTMQPSRVSLWLVGTR